MFGKAKNKAENTDITEMMPKAKKEKSLGIRKKRRKCAAASLQGCWLFWLLLFL